MNDRIDQLRAEHRDLQSRMQDPAVHADPSEIARLGKRMARLEAVLALIDERDACLAAIAAPEEMSDDPELQALAREEAQRALTRLPELEARIEDFFVPRDPDDDRNVVLEVRAGTGGGEAALFAADLLRMYLRFSERRGWKTEIIESSPTDEGGLREASCRIEGEGVYGELKFESGVHRVQRVPATENKGRIHTSTATVAILPEAAEVDLRIRPEDLRIDTFRSGGAGGQHVNKTESAVRVTHVPTGIAVSCQTERSQIKNRALAMSLLRSRLYAQEKERAAQARGDLRSRQVGSADRSEKIRTYNFPQDRVSDHRLEESYRNLPALLDGSITDLVAALQKMEHERRSLEAARNA